MLAISERRKLPIGHGVPTDSSESVSSSAAAATNDELRVFDPDYTTKHIYSFARDQRQRRGFAAGELEADRARYNRWPRLAYRSAERATRQDANVDQIVDLAGAYSSR